ncbi:hypothetical protein [Flavobacterium degerlachei]|jgi:hypothetical protein|uniref:Lipoprotein n=1 Tax=Flavobacterium degerlachei TaxID=229203 RepID=A0A1H2T4Y8_9FLAO|nr:hypothetical protein [Flavobacterium degerlachei]SDW38928.1 hypothetical protein SAMN05444338_102261 [Flavobacterium degerlachei]
MKKVNLFSAVILIAISSSCMNSKKEVEGVPKLQVEAPMETTVKECYQAIIEKDTITLTVDVNNVNQFEGELNYSYYQKDKSFGTLLGNMKGDTIFADYTFQSEGITSIRELVFLKKDSNTIIEGHGEVLETNGKMALKDKSNIKFDGNVVYNKIDCK